MKKNIIFIVGIIFLNSGIFLYLFSLEKESPIINDAILYSWHLEDILKQKEKFYTVVEEYQIRTLYQDFSSEYLKQMDSSFIKEMKENGIEVYHLAGDPSWGRKNGFEKIKREIDKVSQFNDHSEYHLAGLLLDIEPYVSEKEEKFASVDFEIYVEEIKKAYAYIKKRNLELRLAIPYWLDSIDINLLEELIKNSDGVSVMNYNIKKTSKNIQNEVEIARKYKKHIDTIYEIEYDDEEYFASYEEIVKDFRKIKQDNSLNSLKIAYHHYSSINK